MRKVCQLLANLKGEADHQTWADRKRTASLSASWRNFKASTPNQKWTTDVTQVCIHGVKTYLSPIMDMFNGEIIAYTISRSPNLKMTIDMLKSAFRKQAKFNGLIMHSDQGWHYQHGMYQKMLKDKGIVQSMSRKGNCLDNSMMENFFGLMKNELLYVNHFDLLLSGKPFCYFCFLGQNFNNMVKSTHFIGQMQEKVDLCRLMVSDLECVRNTDLCRELLRG
ncbi:IS3 family transposase [Prevotella intermedia]|uniref:IS3 family transposase n=1 Tax=Prevotella intermedia TaxID=28131 RepID=UPI0004119FFF